VSEQLLDAPLAGLVAVEGLSLRDAAQHCEGLGQLLIQDVGQIISLHERDVFPIVGLIFGNLGRPHEY
jgi:hypothetical protein